MDWTGRQRAPGMECERKWVGDAALAPLAAGVLGAWAEEDAKYPEGVLESVYFELPGLPSWREKANGDALKRKVRIRWYRGGAPSAPRRAWLERKDRVGAAREKSRHGFEADGAFLDGAPLEDPGWTALLRRAAGEAGWTFPASAEPAVSIRYRRRRYRCPQTGSRLSVDCGIVCTRANARLLPFAGPMPCPRTVCEAKSAVAREWPFGRDLARLGFRMGSFSKFGWFMERLLDGGCR